MQAANKRSARINAKYRRGKYYVEKVEWRNAANRGWVGHKISAEYTTITDLKNIEIKALLTAGYFPVTVKIR